MVFLDTSNAPHADFQLTSVPPAAMFSISLVLSNWAYLYLGVAFIHMLKAFSPVAILLAAFAFRTKNFSVKLCAIVLVISSGVGLASYGESKFNLTGVIIQVSSLRARAHPRRSSRRSFSASER